MFNPEELKLGEGFKRLDEEKLSAEEKKKRAYEEIKRLDETMWLREKLKRQIDGEIKKMQEEKKRRREQYQETGTKITELDKV